MQSASTASPNFAPTGAIFELRLLHEYPKSQVELCRRTRGACETAAWPHADKLHNWIETVHIRCWLVSPVGAVYREVDIVSHVSEPTEIVSKTACRTAGTIRKFDGAAARSSKVSDEQRRIVGYRVSDFHAVGVNAAGARVLRRNRVIDPASRDRFWVDSQVDRVVSREQGFL